MAKLKTLQFSKIKNWIWIILLIQNVIKKLVRGNNRIKLINKREVIRFIYGAFPLES